MNKSKEYTFTITGKIKYNGKEKLPLRSLAASLKERLSWYVILWKNGIELKTNAPKDIKIDIEEDFYESKS